MMQRTARRSTAETGRSKRSNPSQLASERARAHTDRERLGGGEADEAAGGAASLVGTR